MLIEQTFIGTINFISFICAMKETLDFFIVKV